MTFQERLLYLKTSRGLLQKTIAEHNDISLRTYRYYERGEHEPSLSVLIRLSEYFEVSLDYLVGLSNNPYRTENVVGGDSKKTPITKIPILGSVIAGAPIQAIEEIIGYEEITPKMASTGEHFALKIKGDSMSPRILEGDVIIVKKQSSADNNDIVVVCVNGDTATCKKLVKHKDGISLASFNINYPPMYFSSEDIDSKPVVIIGKVVELRGRFF